ncbi:class I SAM-dependent methyltransferase [uncultured Sphingomonas sp.]|uniref:class I SAM-dependent methyltransferase n=1 Tax=uncultured Sphingomonas sp. TaxID=158754 RepID=UPI0035C9A566
MNAIVVILRRNAFLTSRSAILFHPAYLIRRALYKAVREAAAGFRGAVLDFGCGSKPYRSLFTNVDSYVGVDIEQSGHDHKTSEVDVFYDGQHLPFDTASFDGVVAFEVFEHVFNLPEILGEIGRVLRPGGRLMFSVPFAWPEHEQPYDFARYTSFGIHHVLEQAGYREVRIRKSNDSVRAIAQLGIAFLTDQAIPRLGVFSRPLKTAVVPVLNLTAVAMAAILPRRYDIYSNLIVEAVKP